MPPNLVNFFLPFLQCFRNYNLFQTLTAVLPPLGCGFSCISLMPYDTGCVFRLLLTAPQAPFFFTGLVPYYPQRQGASRGLNQVRPSFPSQPHRLEQVARWRNWAKLGGPPPTDEATPLPESTRTSPSPEAPPRINEATPLPESTRTPPSPEAPPPTDEATPRPAGTVSTPSRAPRECLLAS